MVRKIRNLLLALLFLAGFGIFTYPIVSNQWNTYRQSRLIASYEVAVKEMSEEDFTAEWSAAKAFTSQITQNNIYADVFGEEAKDTDSKYRRVLNIGNDGIMGYLSIPKINVKLSIYHGTKDSVLQTGVGHINGTSLPIGGEGTHSVLAAHRALPSAELFTNLDQLQEGDVFYIHVLDETLAYEVDRVLPMVEKEDMATLSSALSIEEGKDYVTLFTCTPYGVNTHRLLVRGERIPFEPTEIADDSIPASALVENVTNYYMIYGYAGLIITLFLILLLRLILGGKKSKSRKEDI